MSELNCSSQHYLRLTAALSSSDLLIRSVDSVFVFQEAVEGDSSAAAAHDAIVVEQWTVIDVSYTQTHERKKETHSGSAARTAQT